MEGHVKHLYSFKAYLRLLCSYGLKNKEITHPLLCCPLSPSTCSTSFCLFRHPCKIKKTKQQSQTDVMFTCKPVIKTSIKASLRSFATQILISKLIVNINSPILGFVSPPMATKCQLHDNYRWKFAMLTTAAQSGIQQSPRQALSVRPHLREVVKVQDGHFRANRHPVDFIMETVQQEAEKFLSILLAVEGDVFTWFYWCARLQVDFKKKVENSLAANEFWSTPLDLVPEFRGTDGLIVCRGPQALSQLCKLWGRQIAEIRPPSQLGREITRLKICKNNSSYLRWEQCLTCSCCWGLWCGRFSDSNLSALKCYSDTGGWSSWSTANHIKQRGPVIIKVKTKQSYLHLKDKTWHLQCYPGSSNPPGPEDSCSAQQKKRKERCQH